MEPTLKDFMEGNVNRKQLEDTIKQVDPTLSEDQVEQIVNDYRHTDLPWFFSDNKKWMTSYSRNYFNQ